MSGAKLKQNSVILAKVEGVSVETSVGKRMPSGSCIASMMLS